MNGAFEPTRKSWLGPVLAMLVVVGAVTALVLPNLNPSSLGNVQTYKIKRGELTVSVTEQGKLESANNTEIKCRVRGDNTIISVIESGTFVNEGDELLRLDTLLTEEEISERTKFAHLANATVARSKADVARAKIAIDEYLEGRFVSSLASLKKNLAIAESKLLSAKNRLSHTKMMERSEYASKLKVEEREFGVAQADLKVKLTKTQIEVLKDFTKKEELATLTGDLKAAEATLEADVERAAADLKRLNRAKTELENCVIKATHSGIAIYPRGKAWEEAPNIEEGSTVHKDQVLLLMPDMDHMQIKIGIHESLVSRVKLGHKAKITLPNREVEGEITYVAQVARPAGWWTGNVVKYESIVTLPEKTEGLKPGMSVEVDVVMAHHENALLLPTSAVLETNAGRVCWVKNGNAIERRMLELGVNNEKYIVVESGLAENDEVILDPLADIPEAQAEAAATIELNRAKKRIQKARQKQFEEAASNIDPENPDVDDQQPTEPEINIDESQQQTP